MIDRFSMKHKRFDIVSIMRYDKWQKSDQWRGKLKHPRRKEICKSEQMTYLKDV